jgi:SAM-dependent methyltransferase
MGQPALPNSERRAQARVVYGADPVGYEAGRPEYPERVYEILAERCGLRAGTTVLEIGPGTGRATRRLLAAGARVTAVEPDPALAAFVRDTLPTVTVLEAPFEDADVGADRFDLAVSAMAFHWVDQERGLPKLGRALRPGGWAALWWTRFGDTSRADPFGDAVAEVLDTNSKDAPDGVPFEIDVAAWEAVLREHAGLTDARGELVAWEARMNAQQARAFYASTIALLARAEPERTRLLNRIEEIAKHPFGDSVVRPFVTAMYTARHP